MKNFKEDILLFFGLFGVLLTLFFLFLGIQTVKNGISPDYDSQLSQRQFYDTVVNQNVNLVFFKQGCAYCQAGKSLVITEAKKDNHPTFYIDVDTVEGQQLVKKYQVEKAATLVVLRAGIPRSYLYAKETANGKIIADEKAVERAFDY